MIRLAVTFTRIPTSARRLLMTDEAVDVGERLLTASADQDVWICKVTEYGLSFLKRAWRI